MGTEHERTDDTRTAFRTCPLCEATCGLELTLEGDRIAKVTGDFHLGQRNGLQLTGKECHRRQIEPATEHLVPGGDTVQQ